MATEQPLIVIVGPTASGKTGVAIKIAKKHDCEIISADSRAIYRKMDIGTAKPSKEEQDGIVHWGIDLVNPDERFTVADFQAYANKKIKEIRSRGKIPILVGGSGLYIDSVIYNYNFNTDFDKEKRQELNNMSVLELQDYCKKNKIKLPENCKNKRYLVRAIERGGVVENNREKILDNTIIVGISVERDKLKERIARRAKLMFCDDLYKETEYLAKKYSFDNESMKSNIYPIVWRMINKEITYDEALNEFIIDDWHLAKKQIVWFKRNPNIKWLPLEQIETYVAKKLFNLNK